MSPRPSKVDADEVRRLRAMGETDAAIATRHGVTVGAVQRTIERHPLEKRGGGMAEVTPAPYPDFDGTQACVEEATETFFPLGPAHPGEPSVRRLEAQAKRVCAGCPFRRPCLAYALTHSEAGIWGGTTEKERDELRRRHGITVGALNVAVPIQLAATPPPPSRMPREAMRALQARYEERLT